MNDAIGIDSADHFDSGYHLPAETIQYLRKRFTFRRSINSQQTHGGGGEGGILRL